jgi:Flp pilus assembly protein TadG
MGQCKPGGGALRQTGLAGQLRSFARRDGGNSLIEVALFFSFVGMPLLIGTMQLGIVAYDSIEVQNAAYAGALFGMQNSTLATESSGITSAAQAEAPDFGTNLGVTPTSYYACVLSPAGTTYTTQALATSGCTGTGNSGVQFVKVTTSATVTAIYHWPKLPSSYTLNGISVLQVE